MTDEEVITESQENTSEDYEMLLMLLLIGGAILLGYKNRTKIKKWFDELVGKFK